MLVKAGLQEGGKKATQVENKPSCHCSTASAKGCSLRQTAGGRLCSNTPPAEQPRAGQEGCSCPSIAWNSGCHRQLPGRDPPSSSRGNLISVLKCLMSCSQGRDGLPPTGNWGCGLGGTDRALALWTPRTPSPSSTSSKREGMRIRHSR